MSYEPRPYKIMSIKECAPEVKLFRVKTNMNPDPGQFFEVSILGKGESALASCSYSKEYVDLLVRRVGNVTTSMFKLKKGERVFIRGAYGKGYNLNEIEGKNLVLVAGGTGLAPITSLIEYIMKNRGKFGEVTLFFAFRDEEHILLIERIRRWEKVFRVFLCLDKPAKRIKSYVGHVGEVMKKNKFETENTLGILCGPEVMMKDVSDSLNAKGITNDKIFWNMERRMECAIGVCGRCLIQDVYVCKDGPVFRYSEIKEKLENEAK